MKKILLCTDLDRTIIPNGKQPESKGARELFSFLAEHPSVDLAYVSGRDKKLVTDAIADYALPEPDYLIGDVGTTIYHRLDDRWKLDKNWHKKIGRDWGDAAHADIIQLIDDALEEISIWLQPEEKQNRYKISYFTEPDVETEALKKTVSECLKAENIAANLIWSVDEEDDVGLFDILPISANKLEAIRFLIDCEGFTEPNTVFAGDSGNDLEVLGSGLQAILVKNGDEQVRKEALARLEEAGKRSKLYIAQGKRAGMNGNYSSGVVEGVLHFFPELSDYLHKGLMHIETS